MASIKLLQIMAAQQRARERQLEAYRERKRAAQASNWGATIEPDENELRKLRIEVDRLRKEMDVLLKERAAAVRHRWAPIR